jgi:methionyl-tRNA formyltransferase
MAEHGTAGMNILFITEEDVFYLIRFFQKFFRICSGPKITIKGVTVMKTFNKKTSLKLAKHMLGFYGPLLFLKQSLKYAWKKITLQTIHGLCRQYKIELLDTASINSPEFLERIRRLDLDLVISVAAPQIFRKELINLPRLGCINIHSGLLPSYKGMMPCFWALYNKERECGISIHYINEKIDEGKLLLQEKINIEEGESLDHLIKRTKDAGADLMLKVLQDFRKGEVKTIPFPDIEPSYNSFPTPEQAREFRRKGGRLV